MPLSAPLPDESLVLKAVAEGMSGRTADAGGLPLAAPVWLVWRRNGRRIAAEWHAAPTLAEAVARSAADLAGPADALEICLTRDYRPVPPERLAAAFANSQRGLRGIEIALDDRLTRIAPTATIASNRPPFREIERKAAALGLTPERLAARASIRSFESDQFLVLPDRGICHALWRGGRVVPPESIGPGLLQDTIRGLSGWLLRNVRPDGRMTYKYWPSRGVESRADNTIRQFMATVALGRIARRSGDAGEAETARRNLAHNLRKFYAEVDGLGAILHDGKAKLGAMALAALAILEFRSSGLVEATAHEEMFAGLCRGVAHLWQPDGSFRTFLVPAGRNDNQNFYPGEALLFWAALHRQTRDPDLARKCLASFRHYRDWHLAQPNPAFVPWHSQACVMLHEDLGLPELAAFVLDRNDWLLPMQQWGGRLAPDFQGRFFDPARPDFGPPHASSTGVYMEGLAEAWRLARRLGETDRADRYARVLRRGLRAVRQLQFRDRDIDAFYISRPEAVMGGLRTEVYNNEIRVDNVQHCLMALLKLEAEPDFPWEAETRDPPGPSS